MRSTEIGDESGNGEDFTGRNHVDGLRVGRRSRLEPILKEVFCILCDSCHTRGSSVRSVPPRRHRHRGEEKWGPGGIRRNEGAVGSREV